MADEQDILDQLDALPKKVRDFVLSPKVAEVNRLIAKAFLLNRKEQEDLMKAENQIIFKQISVSEFLDDLKSLAEAGKHLATSLQKMVVEELLLPLNDYFGGAPEKWLGRTSAPVKTAAPVAVPAAVVSVPVAVTPVKTPASPPRLDSNRGGPPALAPKVSPPVKPVSAFSPSVARAQEPSSRTAEIDIVEKIIKEIGIEDQSLKKRLVEIITNRLKNVIDDAGTKAILEHSSKLGGIGLDAASSAVLIDLIKANMPASTSSTRPVMPLTKAPMPSIPISKSMPVSPTVKPSPPPVPLNKQYYAPTAMKPAPSQSKSESGDLGFIQTTATPPKENAPLRVEKVSAPAPTNEADVVANILGSLKMSLAGEIQRLRIEQAIKNRLRDIRDAMESQEFLVRSISLGGGGLTKEEATVLVEQMEKVVKQNQTTLQTIKREEIKATEQKQKIAEEQKSKSSEIAVEADTEKRYLALLNKKGVAQKILEKPPGFLKPKARLETAPSEPAAIITEKTKIEDIKFTPALTGPLEELNNFTLKDWQALGSKREVIAQKLSLLRNESYVKYQTGLANFKQCPLFLLAQSLPDEALVSGKKLGEIVRARKAAKQAYLSEAEINDILSIE